MSVKLLSKHHLEVLSLKGGCTGSLKSTHVKIPHCWRSHVAAHLLYTCMNFLLFCSEIVLVFWGVIYFM